MNACFFVVKKEALILAPKSERGAVAFRFLCRESDLPFRMSLHVVKFKVQLRSLCTPNHTDHKKNITEELNI
jgi:hypothetical protein